MYCVKLLAALAIVSFTSLSFAQEQKLNGMDFINPYQGDSAFISNHFEVAQNFSSTGFGEAINMEIKLHDYFGIFGKFDVGFGLAANPGDMAFSGDSFFLSQEGIAVRVFRAEEIGSQLGFRLKFEQIQSKFFDFDSSQINLDEEYYKSLEEKEVIDPEEISSHVKEDLKKNIEDAATSGKYSSLSGGISFNLATAYGANLASQVSVETLYGSRDVSVVNNDVYSEDIRETSVNLALLGSMKPTIPVVAQVEYQYDIGLVGPSTHSILGSLFYNSKDNNFSIGAGIGKVFAERSVTIGSLSGRYYF